MLCITSNGMKLSIYTLTNTLFNGQADKLIARTSTGEVTILDGHLPLISSLIGPIDVVDKDGKKIIINIASGFMEVRPNSEVVIVAEPSIASEKVVPQA